MADSKITIKDIEKANSFLNSVSIKGKDYIQVNQRIKAFRMLYPEGFIKTDIIELDTTNGVIITKTTVGFYDDNGNEHILGTGIAHEWRNKPGSMVNKTSFVENAETSSTGRALGMVGLGIDVSIASAEEMDYAIQHQEEMDETPQKPQKPTKNVSAPQKKEIKCADCGNVIKEGITSSGEVATIENIIASSQKQFGRELCLECAKKAKDAKLKAAEEEKVKEIKEEMENLPFPINE